MPTYYSSNITTYITDCYIIPVFGRGSNEGEKVHSVYKSGTDTLLRMLLSLSDVILALLNRPSLVHWNQSTATKIFCTVLTKSISRVDSSNRFYTLEKEALRSKRGAESVAT